MTNFYLYRRVADHRFVVLPWDKEMTFGSPTRPIFEGIEENELLKRALRVPELRHRYLETMLQAAVAIGSRGGWLEQQLDREYSLVRESVMADPARVCLVDGVTSPCPLGYFESGVEYVRTFARERASFIADAINDQGWGEDPYVPALFVGSIRNAASGATTLAPGTIAFLDVRLSTQVEARATSWPLPFSLGGISVTVGGIPAPLLSAGAEGVLIQTPTELPGGPAGVIVRDSMGSSQSWSVEIRAASPGVFVMTHADGSVVSQDYPLLRGEVVSVWVTGLGRAVSDDASGKPAPVDYVVPMQNPVEAWFGEVPTPIKWSGLAPGYAALQQVILQVPDSVPTGEGAVRIISAGEASQPYSVTVR
jgi:uncharacterized protein (TIGR03437 family)